MSASTRLSSAAARTAVWTLGVLAFTGLMWSHTAVAQAQPLADLPAAEAAASGESHLPGGVTVDPKLIARAQQLDVAVVTGHARPAITRAHRQRDLHRDDTERRARAQVICRTTAELCQVAYDAADAVRAAGFDWPAIGWPVEAAPRTGWAAGLAYRDQLRIELLVDERSTASEYAHVLAHEFGHALHVGFDSGDWDTYRQLRGLDASVPAHVAAPHNFDSLAEDLAEIVKLRIFPDSTFQSTLAPYPDPATLAAIDQLLADTAAAASGPPRLPH